MPNLKKEYVSASDKLREKHSQFTEYETLLYADIASGDKNTFKTRVTDSALTTIVLERSARVMAQFPTGSVKALSRADKGKALLMGLILDRYVVPNANSGRDFLEKLRLWDLYSLVYGVMFALVDWRADDTYVGPDFHLIPIRNVTPQPGKTTLEDSDYVWVDSYHSPAWVKSRLDIKDAGWKKKTLRDILDKKPKEKTKSTEKSSFAEQRNRYISESDDIRFVTKYEKKKWTTFHYQTGEIVREIDNPHENGKLPVIAKYAIPTVDDFFGLGDFARGAALQKASDSLTGLTLDGVKMDVFPPRIVNPNGVIQSSLGWGPGKTWLETLPNSIRFTERSAKNLNTFQTLITYLRGSMLNQNGTTDTATNAEGAFDPGFGKTPQALELLKQRENTRDNLDKFQMESSIEKLYNYFIDLILKRQKKPIEVTLFDEEIEQIKNAGYEDVNEMLEESQSGDIGFLTIDKGDIDKIKYRFYIDADSTTARDKALEHEIWGEMLVTFSKLPGLADALAQQGFEFNFAEALRKWAATSGVEDFDSVIFPSTETDEPVNPNQAANPAAPGGQNGANVEAGLQAQLAQQQFAQQNPQVGVQTAQRPPQQIDPQMLQAAQQFLGQ